MDPSANSADIAPGSAGAAAERRLGRFTLRQLIGKSRRTMAWRVHDPRQAQPMLLVLPRVQPQHAAAASHWERTVQRAARLDHPNLAAVVEVGFCERWPYVLYEAAGAALLSERLAEFGAAEAASCLAGLLQGLAYAHDGGVAHRDIEPYLVLLGAGGTPRLMGLEVALDSDEAQTEAVPQAFAQTNADALSLPEQREAARADVLAVGLLLHWALAGKPALAESDIVAAAMSLAPRGRERLRLPWTTPRPVPEALRAIANRSTDPQLRLRYATARSLQRALEGWLRADSSVGSGPLALLADRLHSAGILPASPGAAERAARLALMERQRTNELAVVMLQDLALSFEMLRLVNSAQARATQAAGGGPVLTLRRAIALLGLDGVRRAAIGLRPWPGPLAAPAAAELQRLIDQVQRAGSVAQALRPPGYDAEVVLLVTALQNLGRLITAYHFPDELQQIRRLMQPGEAAEAGLAEQAACFAVLGADTEAIGIAVARHWGLDDAVLQLMRRLPMTTPPRKPDDDDGVLRAVASCANEAVDALACGRDEAALAQVAQRYARALDLTPRDLRRALALPHNLRTAAAAGAA